MNAIQTTALLGAVWFTACSERQSATEPTDAGAAVARAGFIGDRPYTWSMKCSGDYGSQATWSWTTAGVTIDGTSKSVGCSPPTGIGTRPAAADGFSACVNLTCKTWAFDAASAFKAHLVGDVSGTCTWGHGGGGHCKIKYSATLDVDS